VDAQARDSGRGLAARRTATVQPRSPRCVLRCACRASGDGTAPWAGGGDSRGGGRDRHAVRQRARLGHGVVDNGRRPTYSERSAASFGSKRRKRTTELVVWVPQPHHRLLFPECLYPAGVGVASRGAGPGHLSLRSATTALPNLFGRDRTHWLRVALATRAVPQVLALWSVYSAAGGVTDTSKLSLAAARGSPAALRQTWI
jgi:hypothetical protein